MGSVRWKWGGERGGADRERGGQALGNGWVPALWLVGQSWPGVVRLGGLSGSLPGQAISPVGFIPTQTVVSPSQTLLGYVQGDASDHASSNLEGALDSD